MKVSEELFDVLFFLVIVASMAMFTAFFLSAIQPSQDVNLGAIGGRSDSGCSGGSSR